MERYSLLFMAPSKLRGLKKEIDNIKKINNRSVFIEVNECNEIESFIKDQGKAPDFLLLFESIAEDRSNIVKAHTELLNILRDFKFNSSTKIVVIMQADKESLLKPFTNELIKLDIQDFHFISEFNIDDIIGWLFFEKKELKDNQKYINTELTTKGETRTIIKEVPTYIEVPSTENRKKAVFNFSLFGSRNRSAVVKQTIESKRLTKTIGVTGTARGTGVTNLCFDLAEELSSMNKKVAIIERNDHSHLSNMFLQNKNMDLYQCPLHEIDVTHYDYVILDFGPFFELDTNDIPYICSSKKDVEDKELACGIEKRYCNYMILVAPAQPWRLKEAEFYIEDQSCKDEAREWIIYFNGNFKTNDFSGFLSKYEGLRNMIMSYDNKDSITELISLFD
jgi:hypothetical protein